MSEQFKKEFDADLRQRAWMEVRPSAIELNTSNLKARLDKDCSLMAVVKADGYGHGAAIVAAAAIRGGADSLGVATLQEGIELRRVGFDCFILILGNLINLDEYEVCLDWRLIPTISNLDQVEICENIAHKQNKKFSVHLKVDTGMTRLGCDYKEAQNLFDKINNSKYLLLEGIYSHLALADGENSLTQVQKEKFIKLCNYFRGKNKDCCFHLANSAGAIRDNKLHFNMVRLGLAIYGYNPINYLEDEFKLIPAMAIKARVTFIRNVPKGVGVSYGHQFITERPSRLAVVSIGYADGISRSLSGKISVIFNDKFLPQVGAITMDQLLLDATDVNDLAVGSIVTLLGQDGEKSISPKDWSDLIGSIPWEVLCGFKRRLPRLEI